MSLKTWMATAGTAVLAANVMTGMAFADAPPASYGKKSYAAPAKAYTPPAETYERPQIGNWGGLYFGGNAGYQWTDSDWTLVGPVSSDNSRASDTHSGGIYGGHVGIQHQMGRIVVGVEAAYSGTAGLDGSDSSRGNCFANRSCSSHMDSLFTIGPRVGVVHENMLFFVSTGFASARIDTETTFSTNNQQASITNARHNGWYLGAGFERALHDRWVWGLEYQHVWLDSERHFSSLQGGCCVVGNSTRDIDADANIVRFRLSYKIGRPEPQAEPYK